MYIGVDTHKQTHVLVTIDTEGRAAIASSLHEDTTCEGGGCAEDRYWFRAQASDGIAAGSGAGGESMPHRLPVRRVVAWLDRFRHPDRQIIPIGVATSRTIDDNPGHAVLTPCALPREVEDTAAIPASSTPVTRGLAPSTTPVPVDPDAGELAPEPLAPRHAGGLRLAAAQRWSWAQRELELAVREAPGGPAAADLASVREARRQLRVLRKWPRDVPAQLTLGRCYFELGLGAEAEALFRRVLDLAPTEAAAPYFLALEYAYRGEWAVAEGYYARASALAPDLPPFAVFTGGLHPDVPGDQAAP